MTQFPRVVLHRNSADDILDTAKRVIELLEEAETAQDSAENAIDKANTDIADAEDDLTRVRTATQSRVRAHGSTVAQSQVPPRSCVLWFRSVTSRAES